MLYILRLREGDCILAAADDEVGARGMASTLAASDSDSVVSVRPLAHFAVRLSPADTGAFDAQSWDDATLDDILAHEYPLLQDAIHTADSVPFMSPAAPDKAVLGQLRSAYERNADIIRNGVRLEQQRFASEPAWQRKAAGK